MKMQSEIWKHGCTWWSSKNKSVYNFMKHEQIVIGSDRCKFVINDLVILTEGFTVRAIVQVKDKPIKITENTKYSFLPNEYKIPFDNSVNYAKADWYELPEEKNL